MDEHIHLLGKVLKTSLSDDHTQPFVTYLPPPTHIVLPSDFLTIVKHDRSIED